MAATTMHFKVKELALLPRTGGLIHHNFGAIMARRGDLSEMAAGDALAAAVANQTMTLT